MYKRHKEFNKIFKEKERIGKLAQIRELVFGAQDGLLGTLGLISTVSGAVQNPHVIVLTGISAALAGAFSMATGAYLASKSEQDLYESEIRKEEYAIKKHKKEKKDEMVVLLENEALPHNDSAIATEEISKSKEAFLNTMLQKQLGIEPNPAEDPIRDAFYAGGSFIITSFIPVLPYFFFSIHIALPVSLFVTLCSLFLVGVYKGKVTATHFLKAGFEVLIIGIISGIGGFFLGTLLPRFIHNF